MDPDLDFCGQKWKTQRDGELTIFLPRHSSGDLFFQASFQFVPPWLEEEDSESEHRTLYLEVHGYLPGLHDWRDLPGLELESREEMVVLGEEVAPAMKAPEIKLWSGGGASSGAGSIHTHARDGWETRLKLEDFTEGSSYTLACEVEAFYPSERARAASYELWFKEFIGESDLENWEKAKLREEGWWFRYRGRLRLAEFSCVVPLNTADPVGWAQTMTRRELKMAKFGFSYVNGGQMDGRFQPADGVTPQGRLVLLHPPSAYFYEWQERRKKKADQGRPQG